MPAVIVLDIPTGVSKDHLISYFSKTENGGGELEYILYPFQPSKALVSFKELAVLNRVFAHSHQIHNAQVQVMPLPMQVYGTITAEINPQIMSQIPNKMDFFIELNEEYGVKVQYAGSTSYLVGSWQQLQAAQAKIWGVHQRLQQQGWAQLMNEVGTTSSPQPGNMTNGLPVIGHKQEMFSILPSVSNSGVIANDSVATLNGSQMSDNASQQEVIPTYSKANDQQLSDGSAFAKVNGEVVDNNRLSPIDNTDDWPAPPSLDDFPAGKMESNGNRSKSQSSVSSKESDSEELPRFPLQPNIELTMSEVDNSVAQMEITPSKGVESKLPSDFVTPKPFKVTNDLWSPVASGQSTGVESCFSSDFGNHVSQTNTPPSHPPPPLPAPTVPSSSAKTAFEPKEKTFTAHSETVLNSKPSTTVLKNELPAPRIDFSTNERTVEPPRHLVISPQSNFFRNRHIVDGFENDSPESTDPFLTSKDQMGYQNVTKTNHEDFNFSFLRNRGPNRSSTPTSPLSKATTPEKQRVKVQINMTQVGVRPKSGVSPAQSNASLEESAFGFTDFSVRPKTANSSHLITLAEDERLGNPLRQSFNDSSSSDESDIQPPGRLSLGETEFFANPSVPGFGLSDYAPSSLPLSPQNAYSVNHPPPKTSMPPRSRDDDYFVTSNTAEQMPKTLAGQLGDPFSTVPSTEQKIQSMSHRDENLPPGDTLELETDILSYLQEFKGAQIQTIQKHCNVRFSADKCGEFCTLHVVPQSQCEADQVQRAKEEFVTLYQDVFSKIWKEKVTLKQEHINDLETLLTIVDDIRKKYSQVSVTLNEENFKEITLIGHEKKIRGVKCDMVMKILEASNEAMKGEWAHKAKLTREKSQASVQSEVDDIMSTDEFGEYKCKMGDVVIVIYQSDIAREETDVIVNAAQNDLSNVGGVAASVSMMAGAQFQDQCNRYVVKHGSLEDGEVMFMKAIGRLRCNFIINAVGPMWGLYTNKDECEQLLKRTILKCLKCANETLQAQSVAVPAISTGISGVPLDVCARATYDAIKQFLKDKKPGDTLNEIHLVNNDSEGTTMIKVILQQMLEADNPGQTDFWTLTQSAWRKPASAEHLDEASGYSPDVSHTIHGSPPEPYSAIHNASSDQFEEFANFRAARELAGNETVVHAEVHMERSQSMYNTRPRAGNRDPQLRRSVSSETSSLRHSRNYDDFNSGRQSTEPLVVSLPSNMSLNSSTSSMGRRSHRTVDDNLGPRYGERHLVSSPDSEDIGSRYGDRREVVMEDHNEDTPARNIENIPNDLPNSHDSDDSQADEKDVPIMLHVDKNKRLDRTRKTQGSEKEKSKKSFGLASLRSSFRRRKSKDKSKYSSILNDADDEETIVGDQPKGGKMKKDVVRNKRVPGFKDDSQGIIAISYEMPSGFQKSCHPNPGKQYHAIFRTAFLPFNKEGKEIAKLLEKAFDAGLIFTIGRSETGEEGVLTWADISHKTSLHGGPGNNGYPDITYLQTVRQQLAAKGIK